MWFLFCTVLQSWALATTVATIWYCSWCFTKAKPLRDSVIKFKTTLFWLKAFYRGPIWTGYYSFANFFVFDHEVRNSHVRIIPHFKLIKILQLDMWTPPSTYFAWLFLLSQWEAFQCPRCQFSSVVVLQLHKLETQVQCPLPTAHTNRGSIL